MKRESFMLRMHLVVVLMCIMLGTLRAQRSVTITGRVVDAMSGHALEGASIRVPDQNIATPSGHDGTFRITCNADLACVLRVSYVGYTTAQRRVLVPQTGSLDVEIALQPTVLPGQTVVITATRGRERETPLTFSTLSAKELASRYTVQDIPQLLSDLPSTTWYSENGNGIGYNYLNIRGFDQKRISVMINGIPQNDPEDHDVYWLDFPDLAANLQDIQVQRGGGSAFYGPPAIGGSVNMVTSTFSMDPGVDFFAGYGTYNTRKVSVGVNSGLVGGRYLISGRLGRIESDGYRDRSWTDFSSYYLSAVRFDETMTTQVNFYGGPIADHLAYYGIPKADAYSSDETRRRQNPILRPDEIENFSQPHYELLHEWRVNDRLTISNTLFLMTGDGFYDYDGSWAPYSYFRITPANGFAVTGDPDTLYIPGALIRAYVSNVQHGWLPRVQWSHPNGELTVAGELRLHRSLHWGALRWGEELPAGVTPDFHYYEYHGAKDMMSLSAQELYHLTPTVNVMASVQYAYNAYRLSDEKYMGTDFRVPYHFLNPKAGVNVNLSDEFNVYAQVSQTSREPRLKNLYDAAEASTPASWGPVTPQFQTTGPNTYDFSKPLVRPERLTNLELGGSYVRGALRLSLNGYWMEFRDEIIKNGQLDRFGQPVTGNAEKTRHIGAELSGSLGVLPGLDIRGNMTISRNRLVQYTVYNGNAPVSLDGNAIAGFPDFLANIRLEYSGQDFSAGLSVQHVGDFYTDNFQHPDGGVVDPSRRVDARTVCAAWGTVAVPSILARGLEFQIQVNNVFDVIYATNGEGDEFFPAARRNLFASLRLNL